MRLRRLPNRVVGAILDSSLHRLLSRSLCVIRYRGRRTGAVHQTPTQYVRQGDDVLILVARASQKNWWRNFRSPDGWELDLLIGGEWLPARGRAIQGGVEPETVGPYLDAYLARFPKAAKSIASEGEEPSKHATMVVCRLEETAG